MDAGTGGLPELRRIQPLALIRHAVAAIKINLETIQLPESGIAPFAHACDGKFLGLAVAPQSATASSSNLRQPV